MKPLIIRPDAAADIEAAHRWYEDQRTGLGEAFLGELQACLARIREHPEIHAVRARSVRRAPLRRFPYALYYRDTNENIIVVACFHARQHPGRLRRRR